MATRSRIKQMADAEAERAEAEHPDDADDATEVEPDEVPPDESTDDTDAEPDAPEPELSAEAFAAKLESVIRVHGDNLHGLFGADYESMEACPTCHGLGAVTPESPVLDPMTARCDVCKGWGQLITEAQEPTKIMRQCPKCVGNGYIPRSEIPQSAPAPVLPTYVGAAPQAATPEPPPVEIPPMPRYDAQTNQWLDPTTGQPLVVGQPGNHSTAGLTGGAP